MSAEELAEELRLARRELKLVRAQQERMAEQLQRVRRQRSQLREQAHVLAGVLATRLSDDYWRSVETPRRKRWSGQGREEGGPVSPEEPQMVREVEGSDLFDADWYLRRHLDAARSGLSPAAHYVRIGGPGREDPSEVFDTASFLQRNPAARVSGLPPLVHHVRYPDAKLAGVAR